MKKEIVSFSEESPTKLRHTICIIRSIAILMVAVYLLIAMSTGMIR